MLSVILTFSFIISHQQIIYSKYANALFHFILIHRLYKTVYEYFFADCNNFTGKLVS